MTEAMPTEADRLSRSHQRTICTRDGGMTNPFSHATTTLNPSRGASPAVVVNTGSPVVSRDMAKSVPRAPCGPVKAVRSVIFCQAVPGRITVQLARSMGYAHPLPVAFQYSSSWSVKNPSCLSDV